MPASVNRQIVLRRRPVGMPKPADFDLVESPLPAPKDGEILTRTIYLSLDPYMRGRISGAKSYAQSVELGQVIVGATVGEVLESKHPGLAKGDIVQGYAGWQSHAVAPGAAVRTLDPKQAPVSTALGVLGMPGMTAYVGLLDIGQPKPGETVVVSAASGAVGLRGGADREDQGRPRGGHRGLPGQVRLRRARARLRRLRELQDGRSPRRAQGRLPEAASTCTSRTWAATCWPR